MNPRESFEQWPPSDCEMGCKVFSGGELRKKLEAAQRSAE